MGIRSTLSSILSAPLGALVEQRVRELAGELIDARDLASPADVRALDQHLQHARTALGELSGELSELRDQLTELAVDDEDDDMALRIAGLSAHDEDLAQRIASLQDGLAQLGDRVVALTKKVDQAADRAEAADSLAKEAAATAEKVGSALDEADGPPAGDRGCQVPGCGNKHRARGFCGSHYQRWKRGTLPGFVAADGVVHFEEDGPQWHVDDKHAGKAAERDGSRILIDGKGVRSRRADS